MKSIRILLAVMAIIMSNAMAEAKLTIGFVTGGAALLRLEAQLRQALVELYGEDEMREYVLDHLLKKRNRYHAYFGNGSEMILTAFGDGDDETLFKMKQAFDLLSAKGDTIYIVGYEPRSYSWYNFAEIMQRRQNGKLLVGKVYNKDLKMIMVNVGFPFFSTRGVYGHESEVAELLKLEQKGETIDKKKEREYLNRLFDLLMKSDKELLAKPLTSLPITSPPIILDDYSYRYDDRAEIRFVHETELRRDGYR